MARLVPAAALAAVLVAVAACSPGDDVAAPTPTPTPPAVEPCLEAVSDDHPIHRLPGGDAATLAACAARTTHPAQAGGEVVVSTADQPALAAVATSLAGHAGAPLLLTSGGELATPTIEELRRIAPERILAVGLSDRVLDALRDLGDATVEDVGDDAGAAAVSTAERAPGDGIVVASAERPADLAVAAAIAAREGSRLALASDGRIAGDLAAPAVVVGGYDAVSEALEAELRAAYGEVRRLSGADAAEVAASAARAYPTSDAVVLSPAEPQVAMVAARLAAATDAALLWSGAEQPGRGTDRFLRLGGLTPSTDVTLVGDNLDLALEARYAEAETGGIEPETRGTWIHLFDDTLKTRRGIDEMLDAAAAANLNTVIIEVVRRHDAYYRSEVLPRTPDPTLEEGLDVLERSLVGARDRGLAIHAWVPVMPAYHHVYDDLDLPAGHVWREHGPGSGDPWVSFHASGEPRGEYLDPGVPAVQDHVVAVFEEIAREYPVDAIHHDYIRYDGREMGYNPTSLARFREETGQSGTPAPGDATWGAWRREQTRTIAARVAEAVRAANPNVAVSMAGSTIGASPTSAGGYERTQTWADVFQHWPGWLEDGIIDAVFPMHYFRDGDERGRTWYREWVAFTAAAAERCSDAGTEPCHAAIGIGAWLNDPSSSHAQIEEAAARTGGVVVYSYQQNAASEPHDALLRTLADGPFSTPAPAPRLR